MCGLLCTDKHVARSAGVAYLAASRAHACGWMEQLEALSAGRPGGLDLRMELAAWEVGDAADAAPTPPTTGRPAGPSLVSPSVRSTCE